MGFSALGIGFDNYIWALGLESEANVGWKLEFEQNLCIFFRKRTQAVKHKLVPFS